MMVSLDSRALSGGYARQKRLSNAIRMRYEHVGIAGKLITNFDRNHAFRVDIHGNALTSRRSRDHNRL
jgi:hypothetical protein